MSKEPNRRRAAIGTFLGSGLNTAIVVVQAVVLVPLYVHQLGPELYGAWLGSGDFLVWLQAFDLGLPNLLIQRIGAAHGRKDIRAVAEYFAAGLVILALTAALAFFGAWFLAAWLPGWMGLDGPGGETLVACFRVGAAASAITLFTNCIVGLARGVQDTRIVNGSQVLGSLGGFLASLALILAGWGLWAISLGLVVRAGFVLGGGLIFAILQWRRVLWPHFRIAREPLREMVVNTPAAALGGLGYAVMNQSENAIAAILAGPEVALVLNLTRKAAEVARSLLDTISYATYGPFAHLVGSGDLSRAAKIHSELTATRFALAVAAATAYLAVNASLVGRWVGSDKFGGLGLTLLIGIQMVAVGTSYYSNYLYRACGDVIKGSLGLAFEAAVRLPLMVTLWNLAGLAGLVSAGILTSVAANLIYRKWTNARLGTSDPPSVAEWIRGWTGRLGLLAVAAALGGAWYQPNWAWILCMGSAVFLVGVAGQLAVDRRFRSLIAQVVSSRTSAG